MGNKLTTLSNFLHIDAQIDTLASPYSLPLNNRQISNSRTEIFSACNKYNLFLILNSNETFNDFYFINKKTIKNASVYVSSCDNPILQTHI